MHTKHPAQTYEVNIPVTLAYAPLGLVRACVNNISQNGMNIDTGRVRLRVGSRLEVFIHSTAGQLAPIMALVMQTSHKGSGLFFASELNNAELDQIIRAHQHAA